MNKITISDIAKELGVTPSTVSRALAGNSRVSEKTRELVLKTAQQMGYQPNLMASYLRKGKSDFIGMIVPRINRHFFSNIISGVEEILNPAGFSLLIMQSHEQLESEINAVHSLMRNRVGGIIVSLSVETNKYDHLQYVVNSHVPLVQFDRVHKGVNGPKIVNDNYTGAYQATKHLLESGYKRIAHFGGNRQINVYEERIRGYRKAIEEQFGEVDEGLIFEDIITRDAGYETIKRVYKKQKVDAVSCAGDFAAFGVFEGLKELGISIPGSFGLVGYGNEPFAEMLHPSLTSIEQDGREIGRIAAREMIDALNGDIHNIERVVPVEFIKRESTQHEV